MSISKMLGFGGGTEPMTADFAATHWGEGPAHNTMASNSRVRAKRARSELGWSPSAPSLLEDIETGTYATLLSNLTHTQETEAWQRTITRPL